MWALLPVHAHLPNLRVLLAQFSLSYTQQIPRIPTVSFWAQGPMWPQASVSFPSGLGQLPSVLVMLALTLLERTGQCLVNAP